MTDKNEKEMIHVKAIDFHLSFSSFDVFRLEKQVTVTLNGSR